MGKACVTVCLVPAAAVGCTDGDGDPARTDPPTPTRTASPAPDTPTSKPPDPVSIPGLIAREHHGSGLRLGTVRLRTDAYTQYAITYEAIAAVQALRSSGLPQIDNDRIGLLGRSMGGVVYNTLVVAPGLVDAAVVHAPVSSRPAENLHHFQRRNGDPVVAETEAGHGSPRENPAFWKEISPVTYVDRVTEPLLIHHGTADDTCPPRWSEQTAAAFEAAGKDVRLVKYPGEGHTFSWRWRDSMDTAMDHFERHLR